LGVPSDIQNIKISKGEMSEKSILDMDGSYDPRKHLVYERE